MLGTALFILAGCVLLGVIGITLAIIAKLASILLGDDDEH